MNLTLADARGALPVPPAALEPKRRSLTCAECHRPVGAGRVRHPACLAHAVRRKEGTAR